jgi:hypothetical protein
MIRRNSPVVCRARGPYGTRMDELERAHRARPWRVHALAHDFSIEDVWTFDLGRRAPSDVREFLHCFWAVFHDFEKGWLSRTRLRVGRALRWDDHEFALPIPGCTETSVSARLDDRDRAKSLAPADAPSPVATPIVKTVYVFAGEALFEFSNDTVHALLHVALADAAHASLTVYVRLRGVFSRLYMAAIWPARHLLLYPAMIRSLESRWRARG